MKTFKAFSWNIGKVTLGCIFTLHHVSGGIYWAAPAIVGNGHSSSTDALLVDDRIFVSNTRWGYWRQKADIPWMKDGKAVYHRGTPDRPMYYVPYEVFPFDINNEDLIPGNETEALPGDRHVGHAGPHYGSLTRDSKGYFWVAARAIADSVGLATWVARSSRPEDITDWEPHQVLF